MVREGVADGDGDRCGMELGGCRRVGDKEMRGWGIGAHIRTCVTAVTVATIDRIGAFLLYYCASPAVLLIATHNCRKI